MPHGLLLEREIERDALSFWRLAKKYEARWERVIFLTAAVLVAIVITNPIYFGALESLIVGSGNWGYLGAAVAGFFFAYGLTIPIATVVLYALGGTLNPLLVALVAASTATAGDFIIFEISKQRLARHIVHLKRSGYIAKYAKRWGKWVHRAAPLVAGFIIASPLPDELAALFLGSLRFTERQFVAFVWAAEFVGILVIVVLGSAFA